MAAALLLLIAGSTVRECRADGAWLAAAADSVADPAGPGASPGPVKADTAATVDLPRFVTVDSAAAAATRPVRSVARPQKLLDQPRFVMFRSLLVPGWGQLHNRAWLKAVLVAGSEGLLLTRILEDDRALKNLDAEVVAARDAGDVDAENLAVDRYNARLDRFVGRQWLLGGLLVYALMDAYVDAHFVNFKIQFENDPARPAGVRLGMEKRF